jgi:hypothetical protein
MSSSHETPTHITEAKAIADRVGADAVVILAFKDGMVAGGKLWANESTVCRDGEMDGRADRRYGGRLRVGAGIRKGDEMSDFGMSTIICHITTDDVERWKAELNEKNRAILMLDKEIEALGKKIRAAELLLSLPELDHCSVTE